MVYCRSVAPCCPVYWNLQQQVPRKEAGGTILVPNNLKQTRRNNSVSACSTVPVAHFSFLGRHILDTAARRLMSLQERAHATVVVVVVVVV